MSYLDLEFKEMEFDGANERFIYPHGTVLLCQIETAWWGKEPEESGGRGRPFTLSYIVIGPDEYKGNRVMHNIYVNHYDKTQNTKAKKMLTAVDNITGGYLRECIEEGEEDFTEDACFKMVAKRISIRMDLIKNKEGQEFNMVGAVAKPNGTSTKKKKVEEEDEDVPF